MTPTLTIMSRFQKPISKGDQDEEWGSKDVDLSVFRAGPKKINKMLSFLRCWQGNDYLLVIGKEGPTFCQNRLKLLSIFISWKLKVGTLWNSSFWRLWKQSEWPLLGLLPYFSCTHTQTQAWFWAIIRIIWKIIFPFPLCAILCVSCCRAKARTATPPPRLLLPATVS